MGTLTTNPIEGLAIQDSFKIKSILAGLELGPSDIPLLRYIDYLSTEIPIGRLNFVHVIPRVRLFSTVEEEQSFFEENYQRADELYEKIRTEISGWGFAKRSSHIDFAVRIGNPLEELLHQANGLQPDLVVIGQRGDKSHHGILARNLARKVRSNALVVPQNAPQKLDHLLIPLDFSKYSVKALRLAIQIRKWLKRDLKISCLHVYELPNIPMDRTASREQTLDLLRSDRKKTFESFLEKHFPNEVGKLEIALVMKDNKSIAQLIDQYAEKHGVDLTLIGAIGHSRVELLLMGSVTEKYLTMNKRIPTLIIKN